MKAPERSRASLNAIAPSPIASVVGPSGVTSSRQHLGRERARKQQRGVEVLDLADPPARGEHLSAAGVDHARARCRHGTAPGSAAGPASASDCSVETPTSGMPPARASARGGRDPDPQPGERAGSDPDGDPVDPGPADPGALEHRGGQRQQPRGVAGALPGRGSSRAVNTTSPTPDRATVVARVAVSNARILIAPGSSPTAPRSSPPRRSPPACSMTTRAASARQARDRRGSRSRATRRTRSVSGPM